MVETINIYDELRSDWFSAAVSFTTDVINSLPSNDIVNQSVVNKCLQSFHKRRQELERRMDDERVTRLHKLRADTEANNTVFITTPLIDFIPTQFQVIGSR